MDAPIAAPVLTQAQQEAQAVIDKGDYVAMLSRTLPTLKAEYLAAAYLLAELARQGDVQVKKAQFMKAAGRIQGGMPPMTEVAVKLIASQKGK